MSRAVCDMSQSEFIGRRNGQNLSLPSKGKQAEEEWTSQNTLSVGNFLGLSCKAALQLAEHGSEIQEKGFLFGKHLALAWQARLDMEPFINKYNEPCIPFNLVSAPVMFQLESDSSLFDEIDKGSECADKVDYKKCNDPYEYYVIDRQHLRKIQRFEPALLKLLLLERYQRLILSEESKVNLEPEVTIKDGVITGTTRISYHDALYFVFEGIPYAEPPVNERRFEPPQKKSPWEGTLRADKPGSHCFQLLQEPLPELVKIMGDEDCLYLNVYSPDLPTGDYHPKMDVVVFIHGGCFMFGGGSDFGPAYYIDKKIVFVTLNYRVGAFGFLTSGDHALPANNGLKDQNLALQWVIENIEAFGGNKDSITLTGHSAGGASVTYHMVSPKSQGLFHKAVSYSGTALDPWAYTENIPEHFKQYAYYFNCGTDDNVKIVDCLKKAPARDFIALTGTFLDDYYNPFTVFGPTVEPDSPHAFLTEHPIKILKRGNLTKIPYISGVTSQDGLYPLAQFIANDSLVEELNNKYLSRFPSLLFYHYTVPTKKHDEVSKKIKEEYFGREDISRDNTDQLIRLVTDRLYDQGGQLFSNMYAYYNQAPVYFYQFRYRGKHSFSEFFSLTEKNFGSAHGDDVCYLITCPFFSATETDYDRKFLEEMQATFASFYKTGVPKIPEPLAGYWLPIKIDRNERAFFLMSMDNEVEWRLDVAKDLGRIHFWKSLIGKAENLGVWDVFDEIKE